MMGSRPIPTPIRRTWQLLHAGLLCNDSVCAEKMVPG